MVVATMKRILKSLRHKQQNGSGGGGARNGNGQKQQQQQQASPTQSSGAAAGDLGRPSSSLEGGVENYDIDYGDDDYSDPQQQQQQQGQHSKDKQQQQHYQQQQRPETVRHFQDESGADDDDTLYTTTSAMNRSHNNSSGGGSGGGDNDNARRSIDMDNYFVENGNTQTTVTSSGKRITTTTVRIPPPSNSATPSATTSSNAPDASNIATSTAAKLLRCDETRHLVKQFIAAIWNRGELDIIPDVCSPSLRFNGNTGFDRVGHDGLARMVATIRDALDEYHCEIHSMVVEDNKAFCRLRFTGKHVGPLLGYAPTHQTVAWMGATEFTCQNGKILKVWELGDVKSLEEQLLAKSSTTGSTPSSPEHAP